MNTREMTLYNVSLGQKPEDCMQTVKIVIADDHHLFIAGLQTILQNVEGYKFDVVGVAHTGESLITLL